MSDWSNITIQEFDAIAVSDMEIDVLVGHIVLDRLPFTFNSKESYLAWRAALAVGFHVDARDVLLVGSAATGRSLSARTQFNVFRRKSDIDIAVISATHFEQSWAWFRRTNPILIGLDVDGQRLFDQHRKHYIFDGVVAANYFLPYLPFGYRWLDELSRANELLPSMLKGRRASVRIYKDSYSLRAAQQEGLRQFRLAKGKTDAAPGGPVDV